MNIVRRLMTIADLCGCGRHRKCRESNSILRVAAAADLELIAYPGKTFRALVTRIADTGTTAKEKSRGILIKVKRRLDIRQDKIQARDVRAALSRGLFSRMETVKMPWVPGIRRRYEFGKSKEISRVSISRKKAPETLDSSST
jgi:hypothetical protein